jgi:hypothetical protein
MTAELKSISGGKKECCSFCGEPQHENFVAECGALGVTVSRIELDEYGEIAAIDFFRYSIDESDGKTE